MRTALAGDLHAPAAARRFVSSALDGRLRPGTSPSDDDVVLVVSELVTNAVRADATVIDLSVEVDDERVQLEISDDVPGWPTRRDAGWQEPNGRGLAIVDELADQWHTTERHPGKSVTVTWFRRPLRAAEPPSAASSA